MQGGLDRLPNRDNNLNVLCGIFFHVVPLHSTR